METNDRHYLVIAVAVRKAVTMNGLPWLEQGNFVLQSQAIAALTTPRLPEPGLKPV